MDTERHAWQPEGGSITSVEAFVLGIMAAIVVSIGIPSYLQMRDRSNDREARAEVRQAVAAVEELRAATGSTASLTPAALRRYDAELDASTYRLSLSKGDAYCVQASEGGRTWHLVGPGGDVEHGACP